MRLGVVVLPEHRWADAGRGIWQRAEGLGFAHAWTYDHLAWRSLRDSAWFGTVATLAAAATATTQIRLGTLVASPTFRHPVPFAREVIALDDVSSGRITVGIGAGGDGWDTTILGQSATSRRERTERFEEFVELTHLLLTEREVSYEGRHFAAVEARTHPGCIQQPRTPFAIAATAPRGMRLAARYAETWITTGDRSRSSLAPPEDGARGVSRQLALLEEACAAEGRDPASIARLVVSGLVLDARLTSVEAFVDALGHYEQAGVTDFVVHWPRAGEPFAGDVRHFEQIVAAVLDGA